MTSVKLFTRISSKPRLEDAVTSLENSANIFCLSEAEEIKGTCYNLSANGIPTISDN